ncbi:MAG: hypothetical protein B1H08_05250 [Candidatus Omnitrophica bacterium 4484_171]|nr:MAG: hypothetical protein B1H08_05250 [Candidatus Omnitrophica bacterium 4484_171]
MKKEISCLLEAATKGRKQINTKNIFRNIGFDGDNPRLGWVNIPSWEAIKKALTGCLDIIGDRDRFVFIGMGGSINGIKTIAEFNPKSGIYCLDSLDPRALRNLRYHIKEQKKVMVIPISKSGTTKETQLLAGVFKGLWGKKSVDNFLWLTDPSSSAKLDREGWSRFHRLYIQVDKKSDIGGRFSSPHTLIFLLPLFIALRRRFGRLKAVYDEYCGLREKIAESALLTARKYERVNKAYFSIILKGLLSEGFRTWITQLFQESLGSKKKGLAVKTLVAAKHNKHNIFRPVSLGLKIEDPFVRIMSEMYYLQNFVALYAYHKKINFVNQPCVEEYKATMRSITFKDLKKMEVLDLTEVVDEARKRIKPNHKFIEIILYLYPAKSMISKVESVFKKHFRGRHIFVFVGSDWNHHSYQAAYGSKDTFFILLTRDKYAGAHFYANYEGISNNINTLKLISYATYLTIKKKSFLAAIKTNSKGEL